MNTDYSGRGTIQFIEKAGDDLREYRFHPACKNIRKRTVLWDTPSDQVGGYFVRWSKDLSEEDYYTEETDDKATYRMATMPTEPIVAATFKQRPCMKEKASFLEKMVCGQLRAPYLHQV